jgi:exopolyphosphatase/guanosine-5'-triphosphate,3'-diphosphate pyrophosphatase
MIEMKKYAAIDIGSNAMRLLIVNIVEQEGKEPQFNKSSVVYRYVWARCVYCWRNSQENIDLWCDDRL